METHLLASPPWVAKEKIETLLLAKMNKVNFIEYIELPTGAPHPYCVRRKEYKQSLKTLTKRLKQCEQEKKKWEQEKKNGTH